MRVAGAGLVTLVASYLTLGVSASPLASRSPGKSSSNAPRCDDPDAKPFCTPKANSDIYVGDKINVSWNPDFFSKNSTITIVLGYPNDTETQIWQNKDPVPNEIGFVAVKLRENWLDDYDAHNLTVTAQEHRAGENSAFWTDGPLVTLTNKPPRHYPPSEHSTVNELGLKVGLPVSLGVIALVVIGLLVGNRHKRRIGLGNVMGRNRGYDTGKSRRQRLGLSKKRGIQLQERAVEPDHVYQDEPSLHADADSSGDAASDSDRPSQANVFRQEIERQRTER